MNYATLMDQQLWYFNGLPWDWQAPSVRLLELYIDFSLVTGTLAPVAGVVEYWFNRASG